MLDLTLCQDRKPRVCCGRDNAEPPAQAALTWEGDPNFRVDRVG